MRKSEPDTVSGVHAPRPRPTIGAAALLASALSVVFLGVLGLWTLAAAFLG